MKKLIKTLFAHWQAVLAALMLALLFSAACVLISPLYYHANIDQFTKAENGLTTALTQTLIYAAPLFIALLVAFAYGGAFFRWLARKNPIRHLTLGWSKRSVLFVAGIILMLWLPWIIAYYPGSTPYDPVAQIYQIHGSGAFRPELWEPTVEGWISNSHPILHTLILGGFFELGNALGSQNMGIFMYSVFQCFIRALTFAAVCCYLKRVGVPKAFCLLSLLFFALFPAIATASMVTFKDHLFSPLYVLYLLQVIELVRTRGNALASKKFLAGFVATSFFMPLLKHPGIYIVLLGGVLLVLVYRRYIRRMLLSLAIPAATIYFLLPLVVFPALSVVPAGSQDAFGPFLAQTARVLHERPTAMTIEEQEIIDRIVPYRVMATGYSIDSTDYLKGNFRQDSSLGDRLSYIALWARQGFEYPEEYFEGFFTIEDVWFIPQNGWDVHDNNYPSTAQQVVDTVGHNNRLPVNKAEEVRSELYFDGPVELYALKDFMHNTFLFLHTLPSVGVLFSTALYTFYLPFILFTVVALFKRRLLPLFIPVALSFLVLLISPMDMSRYALPMLETTPLIFGMAILAWMFPEKRKGHAQQKCPEKDGLSRAPQ